MDHMDDMNKINQAMSKDDVDDIDFSDREFVNGGMEDFLNDQSVLDIIKSAALRNLRRLESELEGEDVEIEEIVESANDKESEEKQIIKKGKGSSIFNFADDDEDDEEDEEQATIGNKIESLSLTEELDEEEADSEEIDGKKLLEGVEHNYSIDADKSETSYDEKDGVVEDRIIDKVKEQHSEENLQEFEAKEEEYIDAGVAVDVEEELAKEKDSVRGVEQEVIEKQVVIETIDYEKIKSLVAFDLQPLLNEIKKLEEKIDAVSTKVNEEKIVKDDDVVIDANRQVYMELAESRLAILEDIVTTKEEKITDYLRTKEELYNLRETIRNDRDVISKLEVQEIKIEAVDLNVFRDKIGNITVDFPAFFDKSALVMANKDELLKIFETGVARMSVEANLAMKKGKDNLIDVVAVIERERIRLSVVIGHLKKVNQELVDENTIFRNSDLNPLNSKEHKAALKKIEQQTATIIRMKNERGIKVSYMSRLFQAFLGK